MNEYEARAFAIKHTIQRDTETDAEWESRVLRTINLLRSGKFEPPPVMSEMAAAMRKFMTDREATADEIRNG